MTELRLRGCFSHSLPPLARQSRAAAAGPDQILCH
jgi:hypothetical protein